MSNKSARKPSKVSLAPKAPRSMDAINQDYGRLVSQAGQSQYQITILSEDLKRLNEDLRTLNYEAAARNELDRQAKEADAPKTEAATV